jgi:hypothetical protein
VLDHAAAWDSPRFFVSWLMTWEASRAKAIMGAHGRSLFG